jgi:Zn-dependent protease
MDQPLERLAIQFVPFLLAMVAHEYGHGWMAKRFGDRTAEQAGRLTMNPWPHIDLLGTLVLPVINMLSPSSIMFGWARPVPIDPRNFRHLRPGLFLVAFAGPAVNLLLAVLSALAWAVLGRPEFQGLSLTGGLQAMAIASVPLNFSLALFNLIPMPPLDGGRMIESLLPHRLALRFERVSRFGLLALMVLFMSGALRILGGPIHEASLFSLGLAQWLLGLPIEG